MEKQAGIEIGSHFFASLEGGLRFFIPVPNSDASLNESYDLFEIIYT